MRILLLCHAFNSLTQRLYVELQEQGHDVSVEFDINDITSEEAVRLFRPELIIAPYLKRAIPASIWQHHVCLVVHPGIIGDRGPSALDWAILNDVDEWGVTVLQANAEMDAGDIWASVNFPMRSATKASLYRNEVSDAAVKAVFQAIDNFNDPDFAPLPLSHAGAKGGWQRPMQQTDRSISWQQDSTETVLRKLRSADGFPGIRCELFGRELYLYDGCNDAELKGNPGNVLARSQDAVCIATLDGAVWIGHMRDKQDQHPFKLPAARLLRREITPLPEVDRETHIEYSSSEGIGYLSFNFYNGAMSTAQCNALREALIEAKRQPTRMLVLLGGEDFWSNGMHLNHIEAADSAADESWNNINAIDDLALEIINSENQYVIAALRGNAGAGGVFLARAADEVWARQGVILNPHYKDMGNLYGSEYWTYLLPRHAGQQQVQRITQSRLPMGMQEARDVGLVDEVFDSDSDRFFDAIQRRCQRYLDPKGDTPTLAQRLTAKRQRRERDEQHKPLTQYRDEELAKMNQNFYGFDPSYHVARYNFVYKIAKSRTPLTIAKHRRTSDIVRRAS